MTNSRAKTLCLAVGSTKMGRFVTLTRIETGEKYVVSHLVIPAQL